MANMCNKAFDKGYFFILTVDDEKYRVQSFFFCINLHTNPGNNITTVISNLA